MKRNLIEKIIREDLVNHQVPGQNSGYDWQNRRNPTQMSLVDILRSDRSDVEKAKHVLPHEVQTTFERILAITDQVDQLKDDFIRAYNNPIIKEDDKKRELIKDIVKDINKSAEKYTDIIHKLDQLQF